MITSPRRITPTSTTAAPPTARPRVFNLEPGFEAVPVIAEIPADCGFECRIKVIPA
jgi:hypothetical protein